MLGGNRGSLLYGDVSVMIAKTKALISCLVTVQLICAFVIAYAMIDFSFDAAYFITLFLIT